MKDPIKLELEQAAMRKRHAIVADHPRVAIAKEETTRFGENLAPPNPLEIDQNVKDQIRLRHEKAVRRHTIAQADAAAKPDLHLIKRRLAATVLCFDRGWTAKEIARVFHWPVGAVEAWFKAGEPLL